MTSHEAVPVSTATNGDPGIVALPSLPRDDQGPVFGEPWQAQAFAMAVRLHEQAHFTWTEWAATLAEVIAAAGPSDNTEYYEHWLATLEILVTNIGLSSDNELAERKQAWADAAATTPHGQPIELAG